MDIKAVREQFPILNKNIGCNPLIYLDNSATTQRPKQVIDAIVDYYLNDNANVFRSGHMLARQSSALFEDAKSTMLEFLGATDGYGVIITKNATEAINLLAESLVEKRLRGIKDPSQYIIVTSVAEHNSNVLPWLRLKEKYGVNVKLLEIDKSTFLLDYDQLKDIIEQYGERVLVVSLAHVTNVLGSVLDVRRVTKLLKSYGIPFILDAAQSTAHIPINVKELGVDALVFSAHKMYGPFGVGGAIVKEEFLDEMEPFILGGGIVTRVSTRQVQFKKGADKLVAGTPNVAGVVATAEAIKFISSIGGIHSLHEWEQKLVTHALSRIEELEAEFKDTIVHVGPKDPAFKSGVFAFYVKGFTAIDPVQYFDEEGIAIRGGKHCAHLVHEFLQIPYTIRMSLAVYNTIEEIDTFFDVMYAYLNQLTQ